MSFGTLVNQGSVIFVVSFYFWILFELKNRKLFLPFSFGLALPHIIFLVIYFMNNLLDIYILNYITIPLSYTGESLSTFYELRVWLREYYAYNYFLYVSFILVGFYYFSSLFKEKNFLNFNSINIFLSILIYFLGSHNYYHHLYYLLFFIPFLIPEIKAKNHKVLIFLCLIAASSIVLIEKTKNSLDNLINIDSVYKEYPLYQLSNEIDSYFTDDDYTILALDYVLVLHYLDKENFSYIVHPTNHFDELVYKPLEKIGKIKINNIEYLIGKEPDVILCNNKMTVRGVETVIGSYNCNITEYKNNYLQLDTSKYNENMNRDRYRDNIKTMNVFIKIKK